MTDTASHTIPLRTRVNGEPYEQEIEPQETLAHFLRDRLHLTGTKVSCDVQVCGACTVLVDGLPVSACTYLAYEARDRDVLTIEGLAPSSETLHPLQEAFLRENAYQCGFCTSGMLLTAKCLLDLHPDATREQIIDFMDGNLCRCTGYQPIVAAICSARDRMRCTAASGGAAHPAAPSAV